MLPLVLAVLFASCGKASNNENYEESAYGASNGKFCDSAVISEYNRLLDICNFDEDSSNFREDVNSCIQSANTLISKYPNVNCMASRFSGKTLETENFILTTSEIRIAQRGYTSEKYLNYKDGKSCGEFFLQDFRSIHANCSGFDFSEIGEVYDCKSYVDQIVNKYPNYSCTFKSDSGYSTYLNSEELIKVQKTLEEIIKQQ